MSSWPSEPTPPNKDHVRDALDFLWSRLARPLNIAPAIGALVGLPQSVTRQFVGVTIATGAPADALLAQMPKLLRSLSISTVNTAVRCVGEIRGPVLWSETMAARSATAGDAGIFICSTPARAYDTPDNQVLVAALDVIRRAGVEVERVSSRDTDGDLLRRARTNSARALRYLDHRSLASIDRRKPQRRTIQRARAGGRPSFRLAHAVLTMADEPVSADHLVPFCSDRTSAQHDVLVAVVRQLESHGFKLPAFHVDRGVLRSGPVSYRHAGLRDTDEVGGIRVGSVVFDVPLETSTDRDAAEAELARRLPDGLTPRLVLGRNDIARGVEQAIDAGI